ncbi:DUF167 domain-containing protein [Sphingomonas sp. AP4-R1]|uniref:DUF167 domain-containing protein n=1 Tax=Sphingomonas sp. AP4-R1 TaxID=2735134 RepID=UPI001493CF2F|nr:DUF167 domain-containing protein [Sphingomonas sp. AP4-R1]QJU56697.1 DUF167 domain-containing protein [Sphingomonas sp. AP4-R1]
MTALPWAEDGAGLRLAVRVTPKASRGAVAGIIADADGRPLLSIRIAAPPVDGAANAGLIRFLAKQLRLRASDITIASGETGRVKMVRLAGDRETLAERLTALANGTG